MQCDITFSHNYLHVYRLIIQQTNYFTLLFIFIINYDLHIKYQLVIIFMYSSHCIINIISLLELWLLSKHIEITCK